MKIKLNNKTLLIIVTYLTINSFFSFSQDRSKIDSLENQLKKEREDTTRVNILNELSEQLNNIDSANKAMQYAKQALESAKKLDFKKGIINGNNNLGNAYYIEDNIEKAKEHFNQASKLATELNFIEEIAVGYNNIALIEEYNENYERAYQLLKNALKIYQELKNKRGMAVTLSNIGVYFENQDEGDSAIENYLASLLIYEDINDEYEIASLLGDLGWNYREYLENYDESIDYYQKALAINKDLGNKTGMASNLAALAKNYYYQSVYENAIDLSNEALEIYEEIDDKLGTSDCYRIIGHVQEEQANFHDAIDYYFKSLKIWEELGDDEEKAGDLFNIGSIYYELGNYDKAIANTSQALSVFEQVSDSTEISKCFTLLGVSFHEQEKYKKALEYFQKALEIDNKMDDLYGKSADLNNIAMVYSEQQNYDEAIRYLKKALPIAEKTDDKIGIASILNNIGWLYYENGSKNSDYYEAIEYIEKSMNIAKQIGAKSIILINYESLIDIYAELNNPSKSLEYFYLYDVLKDSIFNEESRNKIAEIQTKYETEKKQKEIELLNKDKELLNKEKALRVEQLNRQKIIIWSSSGGLLLLALLAFFIFRAYKQKQKANIEIIGQKKIIEEKNKDITASIRYAKRIQDSILTSDEYLTNALNQHFVLFKPKDVVSGDFYWAYQTKNKVIYIAADCTGHGVPGAFMSMIGNSLLNEIIIEKGITEADKILNELRQAIINTLGQTGTAGEASDGMDIALCVWHKDTNKLEFAGANNPLYLVRKDVVNTKLCQNGNVKFFENDLAEIKGDKQPIGYEEGKEEPFTKNEIQLQKDDTIYIFSDGYQDQYGGKMNKKFMARRFRQLFIDIQGKSMQEQKEILDKTIEDWKGDVEQIDDILVIGVRI